MKNIIEVIGLQGHQRNEQLKEQLRAALNIMELKPTVKEIADLDTIVNLDISATPALRVNGQVIIQQIVPAIEELVDLLSIVLVTNNQEEKVKKIIVPTDFSKTSQEAYHYALRLAKYFEAPINVVHFYAGSFSAHDPSLILNANKGTRESLMERLSNFVSVKNTENGNTAVLTADIKVEYEAISSLTIPSLLALSAAPETKMFVMGTTGEHDFLERLFGSVSTTVAERADCSVLLIPPGSVFNGFRKILIASDYLATDPAILKQVTDLCQLFQSDIHFVHVRNQTEQGNYQQAVDDIVDNMLKKQSTSVSFQMTTINAVSVREDLNDYMKKEAIDLCILASPARSFIDQLFSKNLTKEMALYAQVPLMIYNL
ncbi:MAG: universal stress protein [Bacteroidota bacterium]